MASFFHADLSGGHLSVSSARHPLTIAPLSAQRREMQLEKDPAAKDMRNTLMKIANEIWKLDENKVKRCYDSCKFRYIR